MAVVLACPACGVINGLTVDVTYRCQVDAVLDTETGDRSWRVVVDDPDSMEPVDATPGEARFTCRCGWSGGLGSLDVAPGGHTMYPAKW